MTVTKDKPVSGDDRLVSIPAIRFLREDRALADEFGAHRDIANALTESLSANPDLRVVGLLGQWGSGKSTVVGLAQVDCETRGMTFFTYDAWLHQSDAPRRAFLEEFLRYAAAQGANLKAINEEWNLLTGRKEKVETESRPSVPIWAGFVIACSLAVPLALNFVRPDWRTFYELGWLQVGQAQIGWPFLWGIVLAAAPFTLLLVATFWSALRWLFGYRGRNAGVVAFFANKVSELRTDVKTQTLDPTALEFQRFLRLVLAAIAAKRTERLVMVVDNLDRLPDDEMLTLWSTIRGLFHGKPSLEEPVVTLPTVLVPVDPAAILRIHKGDDSVAQGFEDKTFDIVFRVPTQIDSAWKRYLRDRLLEVFRAQVARPKVVGDVWAEQAGRILEELAVEGRTPRSLNAFVNQVAVLWLQWREKDVSFAAMAFFAAHARALESNALEVLKVERPWMAALDPNWTRSVAAIRFGATPEVAMQVLIGPPLQKAIVNDDAAEFERLSKVEGFPAVFRSQCDRVGLHPAAEITTSILMLDRLEPRSGLDLQLAWESLLVSARLLNEWVPFDERTLSALQILFQRTRPALRPELLLSIAGKILNLGEKAFIESLPGITSALAQCADVARRENLTLPTITLPGGAGSVMAVCASDDVPRELLRGLRPQPSPSMLAAHVAALVINGQLTPSAFERVIDVLEDWPGVLDAAALLQALDDALHRPEGYATALPGLAALYRRSGAWQAGVSAIVRSSRFDGLMAANLPGQFRSASDPFVSLPLAIALRLAEGSSLPDDETLREILKETPDFAAEVAGALSTYVVDITAAQIVGAPDAANGHLLRGMVLAKLLADEHIRLDPAEVVENARAYDLTLPDGKRFVWERVAHYPEFWEAVDRIEDAEQALVVLDGAVSVETLPETLRVNGLDLLAHHLTSSAMGSPAWDAALLLDGAPLTQLRSLRRARPGMLDLPHLAEALRQSAAAVAASDQAGRIDRWFFAVDCLPADVRDELYRKLAGEMLVTDETSMETLLRRGGGRLLGAGPFAEHPEQFVSRVVMPLLDSATGADWLAEHAATLIPWVRGASDGQRLLLQQRLNGIAQNPSIADRLRGAARDLAPMI
jgi:hypothetical protein